MRVFAPLLFLAVSHVLRRSQFPDQRLNPGHGSESPIAVLSKVGGIDSGVGTGPEERPESLGMEREARATALVLILSIK